ncbi:MAG: phenylacetate--CoA ligase family protein [Thermodesulfobacteriota bacterium]
MIGEFLEFRKLIKNCKLSPNELKELQNRKLRAVIEYAYENVPYYNSIFSSVGLSPKDIRTAEDLKHIPITTKDDLRAADVERITAKGIDFSSCITTNTSGTTGKSLIIYLTRDEERTRRLVLFRTLHSIGLSPRDRFAVLGSVEPHHARLHQRLGFYRSWKISRFLPVEDQIQCLQMIQPTVLWVYPTVLRALLHRIDYRLSKFVLPRILITIGEVFDEVMKERVLTDLNIEIFNLYAASEIGVIAAECRTHEGLHVNTDHVILENLDGYQTAEGGSTSIAVLTTLNAFTMPFIRYHSGEFCAFINNKCSCGSSFPLIGPPQGRDLDMVRLPSGRVLSPLPFQSILQNISNIDQFRIIQESFHKFVLQLVFKEMPKQELLQIIRSRCLSYLGEPVSFDIEVMNFIKDEKMKFKTFISNLDKSDL